MFEASVMTLKLFETAPIPLKTERSKQPPPLNLPILYKGRKGVLLNDYGNGVAYFRLEGEVGISADRSENLVRI